MICGGIRKKVAFTNVKKTKQSQNFEFGNVRIENIKSHNKCASLFNHERTLDFEDNNSPPNKHYLHAISASLID